METETVNRWLERVTLWEKYGNSINLDELRAFLHTLHKQLAKSGHPVAVLTCLPQVGQLLGKLNSTNILKMQDADYQLILQCMLALHSDQPGTTLEKKATAWVQSQVRHSVSYYKDTNPCSGIGESISCSVDHYNYTASLKLLESLVEDLDKVPTTRWDKNTNCLVPGTRLSSATLRDLSELCLPLVTSGNAVASLVGNLLSCHASDGKDGISPNFLQIVTATQDGAYSSRRCSLDLSYRGRVSLWTRHLPALEREILHLCEALVPVLDSSQQEAKQLMCSRQLPKACAENPSLLTAVLSLMELLFRHTDGSNFALSLMRLFHQCVEDCRHSATVPLYHCSHRWPGMESLQTGLLTDPRGEH